MCNVLKFSSILFEKPISPSIKWHRVWNSFSTRSCHPIRELMRLIFMNFYGHLVSCPFTVKWILQDPVLHSVRVYWAWRGLFSFKPNPSFHENLRFMLKYGDKCWAPGNEPVDFLDDRLMIRQHARRATEAGWVVRNLQDLDFYETTQLVTEGLWLTRKYLHVSIAVLEIWMFYSHVFWTVKNELTNLSFVQEKAHFGA